MGSNRLSTSINASTKSGGSCERRVALGFAIHVIENVDAIFVRGDELRCSRGSMVLYQTSDSYLSTKQSLLPMIFCSKLL